MKITLRVKSSTSSLRLFVKSPDVEEAMKKVSTYNGKIQKYYSKNRKQGACYNPHVAIGGHLYALPKDKYFLLNGWGLFEIIKVGRMNLSFLRAVGLSKGIEIYWSNLTISRAHVDLAMKRLLENLEIFDRRMREFSSTANTVAPEYYQYSRDPVPDNISMRIMN